MTIYQKIKRLASKIVEHYKTDLTKHDLRACNKMIPGSLAVWSARTCGTHFVWINHPDDKIDHETVKSLQVRLSWFDAILSTDIDTQWHMLECVGQKRHGQVFTVSNGAIRDMFTRRIESTKAMIVRQVHAKFAA